MIHDRASRNCQGGFWQDAIAALQLRAAELRVEAARFDQARPDDARWDSGPDFAGRHKTASDLDRLADWLRGQYATLPESPPE